MINIAMREKEELEEREESARLKRMAHQNSIQSDSNNTTDESTIVDNKEQELWQFLKSLP